MTTHVVGAKPSGDGPGNAPNAKACNKGGWEDLQGTDGTQFANEEDCVAHAARGGELEPKATTPAEEWVAACEGFGGTATTTGEATVAGASCEKEGGLTTEQKQVLIQICVDGGGGTVTTGVCETL